ncbi:glucans biosynthesis glucosyltransferase MdoH [Methylacidimicrobium tartarophylax]|uniref:Glucans biosynthesis glucosyltransferase H n=1 Tax=Methylacidimicrobium tartarophylax TaxID=1041768 RepID=A0A5E6M960_9BACT|nr:glucans biosynthesis glucosyltransferase MdoH [Methylacidimicrobium tartarophylax]VVM04847.1 membrane glycosyltransferase [Methylacidimicrobium tartarophylax]
MNDLLAGSSPPAVLLPRDVLPLRRSLFFGLLLLLVGVGTWLMLEALGGPGFGLRRLLILVLFVLLFSQIVFGWCLAFFGFLEWMKGGDAYEASRLFRRMTPPDEPTLPATAIVMPICDEPVARVFSAIRNMWRSLAATGRSGGFDFFVLSDSKNPAVWAAEEQAWFALCKEENAFGRIFYRKRRLSAHGKSGNIADFCRRWGSRYRYMVILDADSVLSGKLLTWLVEAMEANPKAGIIQTMPRLVQGRTLFRRLQQFSASLMGPLFAAGSHYWHFAGGPYWGHNAILRLAPFLASCALPDLPGPGRLRLHIMSHDTVEAALMRKAGYQSWLAYAQEGSYEEGPPNLTESLGRDRRWCQGNLQHFWFLFAPGLRFSSRIHVYAGLLSYVSSPLWLFFLGLTTWEAYDMERFAALGALVRRSGSLADRAAAELLGFTLLLLFLPKLFGLVRGLSRRDSFGGFFHLLASAFLELCFSALLAPILMLFFSRFVLLASFGRQIPWRTQSRTEEGALPLGGVLRDYGPVSLAGGLGLGLAAWGMPFFFWPLFPILFSWLFAAPLAWLTSGARLGDLTRKAGLFLTPEEESPAPELAGLDLREKDADLPQLSQGLLSLVADPYANALHLALLRRREARSGRTRETLEALEARLLLEGPDALGPRELTTLLSDPASVRALHVKLWCSPRSRLHRFWEAAFARPSCTSSPGTDQPR